ncbi:MAG: hypothetical protein OXC64_06400 [Flavobacteriaceae bacterium]|nr:hypothetical protein [Flavobacteriaceae bacterium]
MQRYSARYRTSTTKFIAIEKNKPKISQEAIDKDKHDYGFHG